MLWLRATPLGGGGGLQRWPRVFRSSPIKCHAHTLVSLHNGVPITNGPAAIDLLRLPHRHTKRITRTLRSPLCRPCTYKIWHESGRWPFSKVWCVGARGTNLPREAGYQASVLVVSQTTEIETAHSPIPARPASQRRSAVGGYNIILTRRVRMCLHSARRRTRRRVHNGRLRRATSRAHFCHLGHAQPPAWHWNWRGRGAQGPGREVVCHRGSQGIRSAVGRPGPLQRRVLVTQARCPRFISVFISVLSRAFGLRLAMRSTTRRAVAWSSLST